MKHSCLSCNDCQGSLESLKNLHHEFAGQPGLEVTPGREFFKVANDGKPFLKNWDAFTYPPEDALQFYPMPPVKGAITVNIGMVFLVVSRLIYCDMVVQACAASL